MKWTPDESHLAAALAHATICQPAECCGVIAAGRFRPITNRATAFDSFVFDSREYLDVARQQPIDAIVHSHVHQPPDPSEADRAMCEKLGVPWLIVSWPSGRWRLIDPCGWTAPLVGRQWAWGSQDCLSIVRDGLKAYADIALPDFDRDWNWWKDGGDLIQRLFGSAGFTALAPGTPPQHCDVLGMQIPGSPVVNHLALFLAPDLILHQLAGRLSQRQLYNGFFQHATRLHLRHEALR